MGHDKRWTQAQRLCTARAYDALPAQAAARSMCERMCVLACVLYLVGEWGVGGEHRVAGQEAAGLRVGCRAAAQCRARGGPGRAREFKIGGSRPADLLTNRRV